MSLRGVEDDVNAWRELDVCMVVDVASSGMDLTTESDAASIRIHAEQVGRDGLARLVSSQGCDRGEGEEE